MVKSRKSEIHNKKEVATMKPLHESLEEFVNEAVSQANVKAYYSAVCKAERVKELPLKFEKVAYGGACTSYNAKTNQALSISFDLTRMVDPEQAILHELTHQIKLQTEGNPYLGKADQQQKFKKLENSLIDKYMYSDFSDLLWSKK